MRTPPVIAGVLAVALVPTAALAAKPPKPPKGAAAVSITAAPDPVVFTKPVTISGKLTGVSPASGVAVKLEQDQTRPFGDAYQPVGTTATTTANGGFAFALKPSRTTQYRVVAQASPPVTSAPRLVEVRPLVGIRASTLHPRSGALVRFSGIVQPRRSGASALLQRRSSTGGFVTVARTTLRDATGGSAYAVRARIRRAGAYRVKVPGALDLVNGFSRTLSLSVG